MYDSRIKNSINTWNSISKSFDNTRKKPWDICLDYIYSLDENNIFADIACGNGRHLIPASKHLKKLYGIDVSDSLLNINNKIIKEEKITNISLIQSDAVNIPIKDNSVDSLIFIAALHNIKYRDNRIHCLKEIKRILKKDGTSLISVWSRWQDKFRKEFFKKWFKSFGKNDFGDIDIYWRQNNHNIPRFYHLYSKKEFIKDINESGLEIIEIRDLFISSNNHPDNFFAFVR